MYVDIYYILFKKKSFERNASLIISNESNKIITISMQ